MSADRSGIHPVVALALVGGPLAAVATALLSGPLRLVPPIAAALLALVGVFAEVRDRRRTSAALAELGTERQRLVSLLEESDVAVAVLDAEGTYVELGPRAVSILGWPEDSLLGSPAVAVGASVRGEPRLEIATFDKSSVAVGDYARPHVPALVRALAFASLDATSADEIIYGLHGAPVDHRIRALPAP